MSTEGVVRNTIGFASAAFFGFYAQAEQYSLVQYGLQVSKPFVPVVAPVVQRVAAAADPWVESIDQVVTETWKTVNKRVVEPARQKNAEGHVTVFGVVAEVRDVAQIELKNRYTALLDLSDQAVDVLLPESLSEEDTVDTTAEKRTFGEVGSKAQKRVFKKLSSQWNQVKAFSAGQLKDMVQIDLVAYAENGYATSLHFVEERLPAVAQYATLGKEYALAAQAAAEARAKLLRDAIEKYRQIAQEKYVLSIAFGKEKYSVFKQIALTYYQDGEIIFGYYKQLATERATKFYAFALESLAGYKLIAHERYLQAYNYAKTSAVAKGMPVLVNKAKEVSLEDVSEYVLMKLNFKEQNEHFVVVEKKLFELLRFLSEVIVLQTSVLKPHSD